MCTITFPFWLGIDQVMVIYTVLQELVSEIGILQNSGSIEQQRSIGIASADTNNHQ